jgi:cytochrome c-type biogenesis protein CcmE
MVKVVGSVDSISNTGSFTLKDATGNVSVALDPASKTTFKKGSEVTVTGYVEATTLSKSIHATHIAVSDNAIPAAGGG